ncbi:transcription initiation factor TFIID subunit 1 [Phtheirospermum japonicum]|uniref:Transcription initiation factor TFIID subunit 1 n=1 Tax=Phtheirospermum japonicum TaxID=374723 RepID=A0A830BGU7_9LAMI|nr:transcription initiation factor TFIID subunit 1 [Phtheirospermum japonicum]
MEQVKVPPQYPRTADEGSTVDDDEEYEEAEGGNRLLGFMFGNVDNSGDLDVDYLDEDAKEHLAALADKLGSSLTDIDLSGKSPQTPSEADQDYDQKAENAVDYEDFNEAYEGPEVLATEEDFLLPKKDFFSKEVSVMSLGNTTSVFDDENYDDEDDDLENQNMEGERNVDTQCFSPSGQQNHSHEMLTQEESLPDDVNMLKMENSNTLGSEDDSDSSEESAGVDMSSLLPVLYVEDDGKAILRFSEIFGVHEPLKKGRKRDCRYLMPRDKYKSMDASEMVEEDEEEFMKTPCQDCSWMRRFHRKSDVLTSGFESDSVKSGTVLESGNMSWEADNNRKDSCVSAEPMKDALWVSKFMEMNSPFSPKLYPLDQEDWEDRIIWNNSPSSTDNVGESCELSGPDSDAPVDKERDLKADEAHSIEPEIQSEPHDKSDTSFLNTCSILVEPFGSNQDSESTNLTISGSRSHPQLLRLESQLDKYIANSGGVKDVATEAKVCTDAIRRFSELSLQNRDVVEGSWLDNIVWEPDQSIAKPKLIYDLEDQQMLFELWDMKDAKHTQLHHAGAMIVARSLHPSSGDSTELHNHGVLTAGQFNISNDEFYSNRKSSQQLRSHSKKRTGQGPKILHSVPALKLQTMKAKLSHKDVANFHQPKALWYPRDIEVPLKEQWRLAMQGPIKIIMKSLGGKGSKLHVDAEETVASVKAKASKKLDFKLSEPVKIIYSGRELEDNRSLAEQNVRANSVLHLIRTKLHFLPRAQKLPGENKSRRPPGAFKKKSDLSVKDGHVFLMEYCEERPLLLGNPGMGARLCTYYQKSAPGDQTGNLLRNGNNGLGTVYSLDPAEKSPFLGDIKPASRQSCLETNMYRAPIFQHKVSSTDYLLVRSSKGKLSIRRIDRIDVVGQQEPLMEVMSPGSKGVQSYVMNRLLVYMYREFRAAEKRGACPTIRVEELSLLFPMSYTTLVRKRLKNCADLQKGADGHFSWAMKRNFRIPSEEELRRMVTPENVCAYESMQAGQCRLKRLGITKLFLPTGLSSAMNQLPDEAIALAAASHIERELQITPWNLSSNFDRANIERLEITGVGDPSGRGLGFSYVRSTPKAPIPNSVVKKKTVVGKGSTVTGTDADLRRLSMEAARELLLKFNVPEEQIAKLTRWHRIALIRKLSSEQAASGVKVDSTAVSKFARGQRMSFLQLQQQTREKCQEIWERQIQSLCSGDGEENESETEANSDLDSFAGDLENLLDAEEGEEGEQGNDESKHDNVDGVKGLKMRRRPFQTQAEEEIEDEAAEAAELCKMLMDDEEADRKKKKKTKGVEQVGPAFKSKFGPENGDRIKKNNAFVKRVMQPEEGSSFGLTERVTHDLKGERFFPKKPLLGKLKAKKKNETEQAGLLHKKVKILAEGMNVIKEKKSARESFVCGACGQLGHMRTNKNCPKYGEDPETRAENTDLEKSSGRPSFADLAEPVPKPHAKKIVPKIANIFPSEAPDDDIKSTSKAKFLKVKCGANDKLPDKHTPSTSQTSDRPITSDAEKSVVKVNKIIFSNKMKPDDAFVETPKPSVVIRPPVEADRDQPRKKIIIKQPKEIINLDENSQDGSFGFEYRKTKKMIELSSLDTRRENESKHYYEESSRVRENHSWMEDNRRSEGRQEERNRRAEKMRMIDEQPAYDLLRYEESIRREREEEQRAKAKKKKKRKPEVKDEFLDEFSSRRNDRRVPERGERIVRRKAEVYTPDYNTPATKRRRGGEVGLSNLLESIVETLKSRKEISYLFLKPVTKKEAPDYLDIINRPMDLSTIRDKVRRLEYKNRDDFRHDVCQIVFNAHKYNDRRNPGIPPLADQLLELCDFLLDQYDESLTEAEAGIE